MGRRLATAMVNPPYLECQRAGFSIIPSFCGEG